MTILLKKNCGATKPLKIQASLNHLLGLFLMGCNQDKHHRFHGIAGRGGGGRTWGGHGEGALIGLFSQMATWARIASRHLAKTFLFREITTPIPHILYNVAGPRGGEIVISF